MVHPSKKIIGEVSRELLNKKILVGVTASVSVYKSLDLVRALMRRGANVRVIMSKDSTKLINPMMFHWATGEEPVVSVGGEIEHVELAEEYDALVIAPSTANTISKLANGIADTSITLTALNFVGIKKPVILVPAMHLTMYEAPQFKENIEKLVKQGIEIINPEITRDVAHYPDIEYLSSYITSFLLRGKDLKGYKIVVTAGPTREYIDPVRFISNSSSGTMGVSIANEAYFRGADVILVHGPLSSSVKPYTKRIRVDTTQEMAENVEKLVRDEKYGIVILAGAPADFKPKNAASSKIDSHSEVPKVELETTPKISSKLSIYRPLLVGFSAETVNSDEELIEKAKMKKERHKFDIIVANNVKRKDIGFSSEYNEVIVIGNSFVRKLEKNYKTIIARELLDIVKYEVSRKV
ncbi:phosphopantothenoylcysteine decarboxylase [Sulfolobus acidocaldarius SUSAZ]|nr:phosphopantothenoylcysteine decarboxylase [Sulfolobus acidocaldarius SUSAZ]